MKTKLLIVCVVFLASCKLLPDTLNPNNTPEEVLISQFERVGYSDLLIAKNGTYHAVFQESPANGKPIYIYYSQSSDEGKSWSKPITLSDDGTGNGSGFARIIEDGQGLIYAIWKRYGSSKVPQPDASLDGPGGYVAGTLMYKVLQGNAWSSQKRLADNDYTQFSWFANVDPTGTLRVVWSQVSNLSSATNWINFWYADWIREAKMNGSNYSITALTNPLPAEYPTGPPKRAGYNNLDGYYDSNGKVHFVGETLDDDGVQNVIYFNGTGAFSVYKYPKFSTNNTFMNPPRLVVDDNNRDHVVFQPSSSTVSTDQIWDITPHNGQKKIIGEIAAKGAEIQGFQVTQGPGGKYGLVIQAGGLVESNQTLGVFYSNGKFENLNLSNNEAKDSFFTKEFQTTSGKSSYLSLLTLFLTDHTSVEYDNSGNRKILMTISEQSIGGGFRISSPSLYFVNID